MRVMVTGAHGLLGQAVLKLFLKSTNSEILATAKEPRTFLDFGGFDYTMLDITSRSDVKNLVAFRGIRKAIPGSLFHRSRED